MALHRDIFWIGRQWAVTGSGVQAVDQRRYGAFDVELSRLWDNAAIEVLREQPWFNPADFEKALTTARTRFPASPAAIVPAPPSVTAPPNAVPDTARPATGPPPDTAPTTLAVPNARAKFLPQWRLRP
ncbi:MAG: hypothetical protein WA702_12575 [Bradyrhizobium sp.]|uniref:hypothetical protein n=1 Tax=Bradyrhizobium sp. TaxID=376 RepID=UPI003C7B158D